MSVEFSARRGETLTAILVVGMALIVEIIPDLEQGGFTARLPDIPAYGEGDTEEQAIADLREAIAGYIETFGLEDAMNRLSSPAVRVLDASLADFAHG